MAELDLPYPKFIDHAVPGNRQCGVCPSDLSESYRQYCEQAEHSPQGEKTKNASRLSHPRR